MVVSETVERSVRLRGPCSSWLSVVRDSLPAHGCRRIAVDDVSHTLFAVFGDAPVSGPVAVSLSPVSGGDTDAVVAVETSLGCAVELEGKCCSW